ncbi:MAG: efflux RND transporter periplasmic adaptor subunit [Desulforhopalus sp.]|nr:efflux RND transporter periplasmic adaptor subunit [Desulforhopalus sp.]
MPTLSAICAVKPSYGINVKRILLLIVFLLLAGGFFAYRYLHKEKPLAVSVKEAEVGLVEATVANTRAGSVKARWRARLAPAVGGRIATLNVHKGDEVEAGQVLVSLWNKDLTAELELAESLAKVAEAAANEACLLAEYAGRQAARQTELKKNRSTSESAYDEAIATASSKKAACRAAQAQRGASLARIKAAEAMVERTIITAPFAGIVGEVNGEIGEFITPSPPGIATLPVVDLINMQSLYVAAPIDEIDAAQIRPGMEARISLDAYPQKVFKGKTRSVSPYVLEQAKQARTVEVEVDFEEMAQGANLLVGYSADVEIVLQARPGVVRIATEALHKDGHVYVVDPSTNRLQYRQAKVGLGNWQFTEIAEGVRPGDKVVTTIDRQGLADGVVAVIDKKEDPKTKK